MDETPCVANLSHCEYFNKGKCLCPDGCIMHPGLIIGIIIKSASVKGQGLILIKSWNSGRLEWLSRFSACVRFGEYSGFRL